MTFHHNFVLRSPKPEQHGQVNFQNKRGLNVHHVKTKKKLSAVKPSDSSVCALVSVMSSTCGMTTMTWRWKRRRRKEEACLRSGSVTPLSGPSRPSQRPQTVSLTSRDNIAPRNRGGGGDEEERRGGGGEYEREEEERRGGGGMKWMFKEKRLELSFPVNTSILMFWEIN